MRCRFDLARGNYLTDRLFPKQFPARGSILELQRLVWSNKIQSPSAGRVFSPSQTSNAQDAPVYFSAQPYAGIRHVPQEAGRKTILWSSPCLWLCALDIFRKGRPLARWNLLMGVSRSYVVGFIISPARALRAFLASSHDSCPFFLPATGGCCVGALPPASLPVPGFTVTFF